jgi:hypothetical protein
MPSWADLNEQQQHYLQFSVIDQYKLTTTIFLNHFMHCILSEATLIRVLVPERPDQVCQKPCQHQ